MGYLGDDFDALEPADSSQVKQGAAWIRDIKSRVKGFATRLFNLDTGEYKDGVIPSSALQDQTGVVDGATYAKVKVNRKGIVIEGIQDDEAIGTAAYYRAVFAGSSAIGYSDTSTENRQEITGTSRDVSASNASSGLKSSLTGSTVYEFRWRVPENVHRIRVTLVGAGGGGHSGGPKGGGGGEHVEATLAVAPSQSGQTPSEVVVYVGRAGTSSATPSSGGPSLVWVSGTTFLEAGGGVKATAGAVGGTTTGTDGANSAVLRCPGASGVTTAGGISGSPLQGWGGGGAGSGTPTAGHGLVIIEWVV